MNSDDEFSCKIQLPPPMPLLLASSTGAGNALNLATENHHEFEEENDQHPKVRINSGSDHASSSSSSPTGGARHPGSASSDNINDDSVCSASSCSGGSKIIIRHGDSGVNSSDDCVSRISGAEQSSPQNCNHQTGSSSLSASSSAHRLSTASTTPATPPPLAIILNSPTVSPSKIARNNSSNQLPAQNNQTVISNTRPVSPALSHVSFAMEPKFHILTDISTSSNNSGQNNQRSNNASDDILSVASSSGVILPHFSATLLPPRYQQFNNSSVPNPRCVRASTPTTARKCFQPPTLLLSASNHHFQQFEQQQQQISATLPRHHVVRIVENEEICHQQEAGNENNAELSDYDDDSSSSDEDDARIFSSNFRRTGRNNLRKTGQNKIITQPQQPVVQYFQQPRRHQHQLSTIPEQVESSLIVSTSSFPTSMASTLPGVISLVYALLLSSLSIAFLLSGTNTSSSAGQGFSHFLFAGSLIVVAVACYKRFGATVVKNRRTNNTNNGNNNGGRRRRRRGLNNGNVSGKQYDIIDAENGRLTVMPTSPARRRETDPDSSRRKFNKIDNKNKELRSFERSFLTAICIGACIYYGASFAGSINKVTSNEPRTNDAFIYNNISNNSLPISADKLPCNSISVKQQIVSSALLQFWQFLLTPTCGFLLFNDAKFRTTTSSTSAFFAVGLAHLVSSQLHSLTSGNQLLPSTNCSTLNKIGANFAENVRNEDGTIAFAPFIQEMMNASKPFGNHLAMVFSIFMTALLVRHFVALQRPPGINNTSAGTNKSSSSEQRTPMISSLISTSSTGAGNYSWGRLCAITIGSLLTTVAVVWNLAIIIASFAAKMTRKQSIFVIVVGSSTSSTSSIIETSNPNNLGNFLSVAGDGITVAILAVSLTVTIANAVFSYFKTSDTETSCTSIISNVSSNLDNRHVPRFFSTFLLMSSSGVLLVHFFDLLTWTSTLTPAGTVNVWLCYSQLVHCFVQTIAIVVSVNTIISSLSTISSSALSLSPRQQNCNIRSLYLLNAFANMSLFLVVTLKTFGLSTHQAHLHTSVPQLLPAIQALNSAHYLVAAFILLRLAC